MERWQARRVREFFSISDSTLTRWMKAGILPAAELIKLARETQAANVFFKPNLPLSLNPKTGSTMVRVWVIAIRGASSVFPAN